MAFNVNDFTQWPVAWRKVIGDLRTTMRRSPACVKRKAKIMIDHLFEAEAVKRKTMPRNLTVEDLPDEAWEKIGHCDKLYLRECHAEIFPKQWEKPLDPVQRTPNAPADSSTSN